MERNLETERYLLLIEQLVEKCGSREAAAKHVGASESYPIKLRNEPWRNVGMDKLKAAKERVHLRSELTLESRAPDAWSPPNAEANARREAEDALRRIALVVPDGPPRGRPSTRENSLLAATRLLQLMCYGVNRDSCTNARSAVRDAARAAPARKRQ
jgi:hypothetical protein